MYLIDTNYLLRLATEKDSKQSKIVHDFLLKAKTEQKSVKISLISIFEFLWVLNKVYNWSEDKILAYLEKLYLSTMLEFENQDLVVQAMILCKQNSLGLEDNYNIILSHNENREFKSFDKKAIKVFEKLEFLTH